MSAMLSLRNGQSAPLASVPVVAPPEFRQAVLRAATSGGRLASFFGRNLPSGRAGLMAVLAHDRQGSLSLLATEPGESYPALTAECPQAHLFEREIFEQFGVMPAGHPWLKPVRFPPRAGRACGMTEYFQVAGEEVHEVAVGPVHAGVIEPGHFRFQCHGENVLHLEISLGYQHRGVERALMGGPEKRSIHYAQTLAGDSSVGHAWAYCQALEALGGARPRFRTVAA